MGDVAQNDEAIAEALQQEEHQNIVQEGEESEGGETNDESVSPIDLNQLYTALSSGDEDQMNTLIEAMTTEMELLALVEMDNQADRLKQYKSLVKEALKQKHAEGKEERDRQTKERNRLLQAQRVEETQQQNISIVVNFEGVAYNMTVKGIFTLRDLRLRLLMMFPDTFTNESMASSLIYEYNGQVMNDRARGTMKAEKHGQGFEHV